jgi:hypothetical protein
VVITEKMDGENSTLYQSTYHVRSLDSSFHPSRTRVQALHGRIKHLIPKNWRICGENLTAVHSVKYENLPSFFMIFNIWNEHNECLSWDDTVTYAALLDCVTVPVLYRGPWNGIETTLPFSNMDYNQHEGFVVRPTSSFKFEEFSTLVAKWVRKGHVQTDQHWMFREMELNNFLYK